MRNQHRPITLKPQLESMEARDVPSVLSVRPLAGTRVASRHVTVPARPALVSRVVSNLSHSVNSMVSRPSISVSATTMAATRSLNIVVSPTVSTGNTDVGDVKNGPLAKAGARLIALYQSFVNSGGQETSARAGSIQVVGNQVRVDIRGTTSVGALASTLSSMGMQVEHTDANTRTVEGLLPISQLPAVAQLSQVTTISPVSNPVLR